MTDKPISQLARERRIDRAVRSVARATCEMHGWVNDGDPQTTELTRSWIKTFAEWPHSPRIKEIRQAFNTDKG